MLITFFAILAQLFVCVVVFGVCVLCAVFFGFILVVHALDWWNNRRVVVEDIPFASWRKRL